MSTTRNASNLRGGMTTSTAHYAASRTPNPASIRALQSEYAKLQKEPVEGFTVKLADDSNLYKWHGNDSFHLTLAILFILFTNHLSSSSGHLWTTEYFI